MNKKKANAGEPPALPSHNRGYLPHVEGAEYQMITYRLNDALPQSVIRTANDLTDSERRKHTETVLDTGYGRCWLAHPEVAAMLVENWWHFHGERYHLLAYVVMPNHVHLLIEVFEGESLSRIVHSWKSFSAKRLVEIVQSQGESLEMPVWQPEYWDRFIRNQKHFDAAIDYIHENPVKAGLCATAEAWQWSSSRAGGLPA